MCRSFFQSFLLSLSSCSAYSRSYYFSQLSFSLTILQKEGWLSLSIFILRFCLRPVSEISVRSDYYGVNNYSTGALYSRIASAGESFLYLLVTMFLTLFLPRPSVLEFKRRSASFKFYRRGLCDPMSLLLAPSESDSLSLRDSSSLRAACSQSLKLSYTSSDELDGLEDLTSRARYRPSLTS